jgi:hypothetical protein
MQTFEHEKKIAKIIIVHGEKKLQKEIDWCCIDCSKHRSLSDWCNYKNQRACPKIKVNFKGRIDPNEKNEYPHPGRGARMVYKPLERFDTVDVVTPT